MILAQTSEWLALNKPAGWLSIPGRNPASHTPVLVDWVRERHPTALIVHRLDRETSGVILFALTEEAHRKANQWFSSRQTKKTYSLLAQGVPSAPIFKITEPIDGAPSTTQVEVKEKYLKGFFAFARPVTGRRHQIRIHLKLRGHPLWGDREYGGPSEIVFEQSKLSVQRVALHASRLELPSGEKFEAPLPEDFQAWLETLRSKGAKA